VRVAGTAISDDLHRFTLLLDDLAPATPGVQAEGCTVQQAFDAVVNLAGLHAPTWNDPELIQHEWLAPMDDATSAFVGDLLVGATEEFVGRFAEVLSADDVATLRDAAACVGAWGARRADDDALSLMHGDYRLDNLMFPTAGGWVAALDWQTVTIAPPARDLAYFLETSLDTELRRAHERDIVAAYVESITARGVSGVTLEGFFDDYRRGLLQGPLITVLGCAYATAEPTPRSDAMFLAMATRSCAAIRDLDALTS
jgi:aminoglycoside/choline kinase family phosphotransferase